MAYLYTLPCCKLVSVKLVTPVKIFLVTFPSSSFLYRAYSGAPVEVQETFIELSFKGFTVKLAGVGGPVNGSSGVHSAKAGLSPTVFTLPKMRIIPFSSSQVLT